MDRERRTGSDGCEHDGVLMAAAERRLSVSATMPSRAKSLGLVSLMIMVLSGAIGDVHKVISTLIYLQKLQ